MAGLRSEQQRFVNDMLDKVQRLLYEAEGGPPVPLSERFVLLMGEGGSGKTHALHRLTDDINEILDARRCVFEEENPEFAGPMTAEAFGVYRGMIHMATMWNSALAFPGGMSICSAFMAKAGFELAGVAPSSLPGSAEEEEELKAFLTKQKNGMYQSIRRWCDVNDGLMACPLVAIIDEISLVSNLMLNAINHRFKQAAALMKKKYNLAYLPLPLLICVGDPKQLNHIQSEGYESHSFDHSYAIASLERAKQGIYLFTCNNRFDPSDVQFIDVVNDIREQSLSFRVKEFIKERQAALLQYNPHELYRYAVCITPRRNKVTAYNEQYAMIVGRTKDGEPKETHVYERRLLKTPPEGYQTGVAKILQDMYGKFEERYPRVQRIFRGARVRATHKFSPPNGPRQYPGQVYYVVDFLTQASGRVVPVLALLKDLSEKDIARLVDEGKPPENPVPTIVCEPVAIDIGPMCIKDVVRVEQLPLEPETCTTVHGCQGRTYPRNVKVRICLSDMRSFSQLYVAVSRAVTGEQILFDGDLPLTLERNSDGSVFLERVRDWAISSL